MTDFRLVELGTGISQIVTCEFIRDIGHRINFVTMSTDGIPVLYIEPKTNIRNSTMQPDIKVLE